MQSSCKKDNKYYPDPPAVLPDSLPPITTEGNNTFGCLVNDSLWLPYGLFQFDVHFENGMLYLNSEKSLLFFDAYSSITIKSTHNTISKIGKYKIQSFDQDKMQVGGDYYIDRLNYYTDDTYIGELEILRLDTINKIVSGTFYFSAKSKYSTDTVKVSKGRFDVRFQ